ncbi:B3 domain-containing transcription factor VRN1 isoform X3 [Populus alba]|nr:B3 domain-containing transcription factor VRN1-like isoform X3 [Populus alba]
MFVAKPPHFFKVILEDSLREGKLMLPQKFVTRCGMDLTNLARLKVLGEAWEIELTKCDGKVWLQKGWKEFAEYYSVACGHFLVFEYEGNCDFHVLIFDNSATEIDYPLKSNRSEVPGRGLLEECKKHRGEENNSVEILDHFSPSRRTRKKSPLPCPRPHKMVRAYSTYETGTCSKLNTSVEVPPTGTWSGGMKLEGSKTMAKLRCSVRGLDEEDSIRGGRGMLMARGQRLSHAGAIANMRPLTCYEKAKALCRASAFKSENPFFKVAMSPSYVHTGYKLSVPSSFARKYFTKNKGNVSLCVTDGRTWPVKYHNRTKYGVIFCHGWRAFAKDNKLAVGDFCVFELINVTEMSLKVLFFRLKDVESLLSSADMGGANQVEPNKSLVAKPQSEWNSRDGAGISDPDDEHKPGEFEHSESRFEVEPDKFGKPELKISSSVLVTRGSETESKFISTHPFFKVVLRSYFLNRCFVSVPMSFVERYFKHKSQTLMLQVADRSWPVKLIIRWTQRQAILSAGWARFARENSLQVGDVCAFEIIKNGMLKVLISRSGR